MARFLSVILIISMLFTLASCSVRDGATDDVVETPDVVESSDVNEEPIVTETPAIEELTSSPFIEDLEYLAYVLENNFSLYDVAYWAHGADIPASIDGVRNDILDNPDMDVDEFFASLRQHFVILKSIGHFSFLTPPEHQYLVTGTDLFWRRMNPGAIERLRLPHVIEFYEQSEWTQLDESEEELRKLVEINIDLLLLQDENQLAEKMIEALAKADKTELMYLNDHARQLIYDSPNTRTAIIEEGRVAYLSVLSFITRPDAAERKQINDFYDEIRDYEHLIIDIRQNAGGWMEFFNRYLMGAMISEDYDIRGFAFFSNGNYVSDFFPSEYIQEMTSLRNFSSTVDLQMDSQMLPVAEIIEAYELPELNLADMERMDYGFAITTTVSVARTPPAFVGKVWFLTGPHMTSASQISAWIAKESGFATLVGEITGGAYGGPRTLVPLPNSGIVFAIDMFYVTDQHGRPLEAGTIPHHFNREGMDALETTLALISEGQY